MTLVQQKETFRIERFCFFLTLFFVLCFPRAGLFRESDQKYYMFSILTFSITLLVTLVQKRYWTRCKQWFQRYPAFFILYGSGIVFFLGKYILTTALGIVPIGTSTLFYSALFFYPLFFLLVLLLLAETKKRTLLLNFTYVCFLFISAYAFLQIIFGVTKIAIPGVTYSYPLFHQYGPKHWIVYSYNGVLHGDIKIMSTYENGNIFAICLLLLAPLLFLCKPAFFKHPKLDVVFKTITIVILLVLIGTSLSRSAYAGAFLLCFFLFLMLYGKTMIRQPKKLIGLIVGIAALGGFLLLIPSVRERVFTTSWDKLLDMNGRVALLIKLIESLREEGALSYFFIGADGFQSLKGVQEMIPFHIYYLGGIVGVILFYGPFAYASFAIPCKTKESKILQAGIFAYLCYSVIDGGFWYPPTSFLLFMLLAMRMLTAEQHVEKKSLENELVFPIEKTQLQSDI